MPEIVQSFFSFEADARQTPSLVPKTRGIALNPDAILRLNSTEEYFYQQGFLTLFKLAPNPEAKGCYRLLQHPLSRPLDPSTANIQTPHTIYPFVILETKQGLDLRIGLGGHYHTADKAESVLAAGDLHFTPDGLRGGFLSKVTDQSGTYHKRSSDTLKEQRHQYDCSINAMRAVGLPVDDENRFCPFQEPTATKPLLFSSRAAYGSSCYSAKPLHSPCGSQSELPSHPCTDAAPRGRLPAL